MTAMWQQIKQHRVAIGVVGSFLVVVIALIIVVVWFNGTGFDGYYQMTTARTISGPSSGTVVRTEVYQPGKALWDWLQLLIIPAVLVVGGFLLNYTTGRNERQANEQRAQAERDVALDNQRAVTLQAYIDSMSELLLEKNLRKSGDDDEVRKIARVRTLTVLPRLDGRRKAIVLQFLYESNLIHRDNCIIRLHGADLRETNLFAANLNEADLNGVNLSEANLDGADLNRANLTKANLSKASMNLAALDEAELITTNLTGADLGGAILSKANLRFANLSGANLSETSINKIGIHVDGANLAGANLRGANLKEANLRRALLIGATLDQADLSSADLYKVKVTTEQLNEARSLKDAIMPDGSKHA